MSAATIVLVAQALYLCDGHVGFPGGKTDLIGLFNSIRAVSYPHVQPQFVVFARLLQGLGQVFFYADIRYAATQQLIHVSSTHMLVFPDRDTVVEMALTLKGVRFPRPGIYLVELFCEAQWVADARVLVHGTGDPMNPEELQHLRPQHQPETASTASWQSFEDPEGGLPLDSPVVAAREQQGRGRPGRVHTPEAGADDKVG